jgi:hypothetical protein
MMTLSSFIFYHRHKKYQEHGLSEYKEVGMVQDISILRNLEKLWKAFLAETM